MSEDDVRRLEVAIMNAFAVVDVRIEGMKKAMMTELRDMQRKNSELLAEVGRALQEADEEESLERFEGSLLLAANTIINELVIARHMRDGIDVGESGGADDLAELWGKCYDRWLSSRR